jgi:hypothetical protein
MPVSHLSIMSRVTDNDAVNNEWKRKSSNLLINHVLANTGKIINGWY